jgi:hypothetical protein
VKYEAPLTPEDEMRLSVASIVSFTCACRPPACRCSVSPRHPPPPLTPS